ncbi:protein FAR1-RELATED SEQUENCE 5-like [Silene latifolia]|uniref:protein FAR1-RELATED SEQUENCE 5-like n=1 Tax=Silene latifolia TaxID=37657 RepID=UPI003D76CC4A
MEIVDITMIESGVDSNVTNNSQCSVTPLVGCGEVPCSNVGSGQDARKSSNKRFKDGVIRTKCMVCHRESFNKRKNRPPKADAKTTTVETGDKTKAGALSGNRKTAAKTGTKRGGGGDEEAQSSNKQRGTRITKIKREFEKIADNINQLNEYHKQLIIQNSRLNVGASLTYNLCKEQAEGFENVGATLMQFKNFSRNVKCLLNGKDGHMFISHLETLRETKGLVFAYETDVDSALTRIFWTNADSIRCYALFGDAISFDPTYGMNKYNMKFAPFTGIDNHKKSITFGCLLLEYEDDDSFIWAFQQFMKAMGGKEPNYIISDQDAGIINAVPARHRFCMWHIMKKVTDKVGSTICKETDFLSRLNNVVWSEDLEPKEFEENWAKVISESSLEGNKWLTGKFAE